MSQGLDELAVYHFQAFVAVCTHRHCVGVTREFYRAAITNISYFTYVPTLNRFCTAAPECSQEPGGAAQASPPPALRS
eukprot:1181394-Prorocentrum_minimum.AAC.1